MLNTLRGIKHKLVQDKKLHEQQAARQDWIQSLKAQNCVVASSVSLTGREQPHSHIKVGSVCALEEDVTIWIAEQAEAHPHLELGSNVHVGRNTYLGVYEPISIGNFTMIGAYCYIISGNHNYSRRDIPMYQQGFTGQPIVIEEDVWIGTHVVILPGITIGKGAIIAAGSVVNKNVPSYEIWGGTPAKFLKNRP